MKKSLFDTYGKIKIFFVDEFEIRNLSLSNEEFSNYAIHSDFPRLIPKNEIWLSRDIDPKEGQIILEEALTRIKNENKGLSKDKAYDKGLIESATLRNNLSNSKDADKFYSEVPSEIYVEKFLSLKDVKIFIVDGVSVRNLYKTDFVEGGHGYVYWFIPIDEVWIDKEVEEDERLLILIHELTERRLMKDKKYSYEKAHELSSKIEWKYRSKLMSEK